MNPHTKDNLLKGEIKKIPHKEEFNNQCFSSIHNELSIRISASNFFV